MVTVAVMPTSLGTLIQSRISKGHSRGRVPAHHPSERSTGPGLEQQQFPVESLFQECESGRRLADHYIPDALIAVPPLRLWRIIPLVVSWEI